MSFTRAPGYSMDISDASRIASRRARGLGGVIQLGFESGDKNRELVTWYQGRSTVPVRAVQLRRERDGPYFHQFIVFKLANERLFRIDRRLRPNEPTPLNSLNDEGIPAFDTIEPVVKWDDPLFAPSDCLISIEFMVDVHLALILKICQQIQAHRLARVYTLQRYNCYFFAQTLIMCIACGASNWVGTVDWLSQQHNYDSSSSRQGLPTLNYNDSIFGLETPINRNTDYPEAYGNPFGTRATRSRYDFHPGAYHSQEGYNYWESYDFIHITRSITVPQHSKVYNGLMFASLDSVTHLMVIKTNRGTLPTGDQETILNLESIPRAGRSRRSIFRWRKGKKIQDQDQETMTASTIEGMRNYIGDLISDHSTRVEEYRWATKAGAFEVYDDISEAIDEIWKSLVQ